MESRFFLQKCLVGSLDIEELKELLVNTENKALRKKLVDWILIIQQNGEPLDVSINKKTYIEEG